MLFIFDEDLTFTYKESDKVENRDTSVLNLPQTKLSNASLTLILSDRIIQCFFSVVQ